MSWMIQAIQAVTKATSVSTLSVTQSQIFSISYHQWYLHSVLKPSPTMIKSQDTLNILRRTRGYHKYCEKYDQFTAVLSRAGLTVPGEKKSKIFNLISDFYEFIYHSQIRMLANTFMISFCKSSTVL